MNTKELASILTNAIEHKVSDIRSVTNKKVTTSKELFDPSLLSYFGLAKIEDTYEIAWALSQDGDDWEVQYRDVVDS